MTGVVWTPFGVSSGKDGGFVVPLLPRRAWLVAAVVLLAAPPAPAAELDKYLLDDTDFVLSMNVKQVLSSPAFTKHYQKQVEELLKMEPVQRVLKDSGFDPLKDVDRLM